MRAIEKTQVCPSDYARNGAQRARIVEKIHKPPLGTLADAQVRKGDVLIENEPLGSD